MWSKFVIAGNKDGDSGPGVGETARDVQDCAVGKAITFVTVGLASKDCWVDGDAQADNEKRNTKE
jgi:hypothetical protein